MIAVKIEFDGFGGARGKEQIWGQPQTFHDCVTGEYCATSDSSLSTCRYGPRGPEFHRPTVTLNPLWLRRFVPE